MTIAQLFRLWLVLALSSIAAGMLFLGCAPRTIYVPSGEPVRLAAPIKSAPVWVRDSSGTWVRGRVNLEEGWYVLADPGPNEK
jgi:hypothetical protein